MRHIRLWDIGDDPLLDCVRGEYVLLHNGKEKFWAQVLDSFTETFYFGLIQSKLNENYSYKQGDIILFEKKNIFGILSSLIE